MYLFNIIFFLVYVKAYGYWRIEINKNMNYLFCTRHLHSVNERDTVVGSMVYKKDTIIGK